MQGFGPRAGFQPPPFVQGNPAGFMPRPFEGSSQMGMPAYAMGQMGPSKATFNPPPGSGMGLGGGFGGMGKPPSRPSFDGFGGLGSMFPGRAMY
jgi:hypothetical protein